MRAQLKQNIGTLMAGKPMISSERNFEVYLLLHQKRRISGNVKSLNCKPSPIPSGGIEVPLLLIISCPEE